MCLSVPMRVLHTDGWTADCEALGQRRALSLALLQGEDVQPGDFLLGHRGQALRKVPADEALASQALFRQLLEALDGPTAGTVQAG